MLSRKAKYAIKALIALSKNGDNPPMRILQISLQERIPPKYLEVILLELKNGGYLHSRKGTAGGYLLSKRSEDIYLDGVVRLIDGAIAQIHCASTFHYHKCEECPLEATCAIRDLYIEIRAADLKILSATSVADMVAKEKTLAKSLLNGRSIT